MSFPLMVLQFTRSSSLFIEANFILFLADISMYMLLLIFQTHMLITSLLNILFYANLFPPLSIHSSAFIISPPKTMGPVNTSMFKWFTFKSPHSYTPSFHSFRSDWLTSHNPVFVLVQQCLRSPEAKDKRWLFVHKDPDLESNLTQAIHKVEKSRKQMESLSRHVNNLVWDIAQLKLLILELQLHIMEDWALQQSPSL